MTTKILEIFASAKHKKNIEEILKGFNSFDCYFDKLNENRFLARTFINSEEIEEVLDVLESYFSNEKDYRIVIIPIEASVSHLKNNKPQEKNNKLNRISREELHASISRSSEFSSIYLFLVGIASLVAALGIIHDNVIAIIGSMVIAPLLGPNIALVLATTLADSGLAKKAIKSIGFGFFLAIFISFLIGIFLNVDVNAPEIALRTNVSLTDIAIALASGSAGAIAFTTGYFLTSLMGVMVAVALLPPLVVFGLLLGSGEWNQAIPALLLLMINFVCINLAGIFTFVALKVKPRTWWEADKAKKDSRLVMILWTFLLSILILLILLMERGINVSF